MNMLHVLIDELDDAADDQALARWLLSAPPNVLMTYSASIANRMHNRAFPDGIAYLEAEIVTYRAVRVDGLIVKDNPLRAPLLAIAEGRPFEGEPMRPGG